MSSDRKQPLLHDNNNNNNNNFDVEGDLYADEHAPIDSQVDTPYSDDESDDFDDDEEEVKVGVVDSSLQRRPGICGGVMDDCRRRFPLYGKDLKNGFSLKTLSSALFMFFATFTSTVALGVKIQGDLDRRIGVSEYLLMNSIAGMTHALLGCQPMLVLRPTGPITLILTLLSKLADDVFYVNFWQLVAWTGFFVAFYMTIVSIFEISRFITHLTRFTHEIFAFFVCSIYIEDGISSVIARFQSATDAEFAGSLFQAMLAFGTFAIALFLHGARKWTAFSECFRDILSDYAVTIAVFLMSAISFAPQLPGLVQYVDVPEHFGPTCHIEPYNASNTTTPPCAEDIDNATTPTRTWIPELWNDQTPDLLPLYAAGCGLLIIFFFYFDQNISSLYTQLPSKKLQHGSYYHSSFQWMGIFNAIGPLTGLPFVTGSLPHSPQFIRAVTVYKEKKEDQFLEDVAAGSNNNHNHGTGKKRKKRKRRGQSQGPKILEVQAVHENRIAPFVMYFLIGGALFVPAVIEVIPFGAVDGLLTFVGVAGLLECQLWERILLVLRAPSEYPEADKETTPYLRGVSACKMHLYTLIQLLLLAGCWAVNVSPAGLAFSLVVVVGG